VKRLSPAMCVISIRFLSQHLGTGDLSLPAVCMSARIPQKRTVESLKRQH
jgi:hypothetical protein